jgi:hypothetical protein
MKIFVAHASAFDFEGKLYTPLRASELSKAHEFVLPEEEKYKGTWNTKEVIQSCGLLIADASVASTGAGIEMGWANASGIPIIVAHEKGSTPSTVVKYLTDTVIEYENPADLIEKLTAALAQIQ